MSPTFRNSRTDHACHFLSNTLFLTAFLLLTAWSGTAQAQLREMVVEPVQAPDQAVVLFPEHPEEAVIIINSSLTNLTFDSNMGGIVADRSEPNQGVYRLIIRPYTQHITVSAPGFIQNRFRVAGLQPKDVKYYSIQPTDPDAGRLPINFIIEPEGASLFIGNSQEDPTSTIDLSEGEHPIRIELIGHRTVNDTIVVSREQTLFEFQLDLLEKEVVKFRSEPTGATLYLDNIREGVTDLDNYYYPGQYLVRLTLDGYRDLEQQITVVEEEDGENLFDFKLEKFATTLTLFVEPSDARILIDGRNIGDERTLDLRPGPVRIDVDRDGFKPFTEQLRLQAGQTDSLEISLEVLSGTLQYRVRPVVATAYLVNERGQVIRQWNGTQPLRDVPVGTYFIVSKMEGYTTQVEQVTIREGESFPFEVELEQGPVGLAESRMLARLRTQQALDEQTETPLAGRISEIRDQAEVMNDPAPAQQAPPGTPSTPAAQTSGQTAEPPAPTVQVQPQAAPTSDQSNSSAPPESKPSAKYSAFYIGTSIRETYYSSYYDFNGNPSLYAGVMNMGRFFLLDLRAGYSRLEDVTYGEYMDKVYGAAGLGAHIKLGPIDVYGLVGASASQYTLDTGITEEIQHQNDTYYEVGAHLLLGRTFGLKYGYRQTFKSGLDDFNDVQWHDASILFRF